jgi:hypothetical protein
MSECRYGDIFKEFLHGKFNRNELMKWSSEADKKDLDDYAIVDKITILKILNFPKPILKRLN